jgi:hypothetical protein
MSTAPVEDKDQLEVQDRDNLQISYKNFQLSQEERYKQIQKELQDTKRHLISIST